jgi:hypothetical protein
MATPRWLTQRFTHLCTVQQNTGTAQSNSGYVTPAWADQYGSQPCRFEEYTERFADERAGAVLLHRLRVLMNATADVDASKRLRWIRDSSGGTVAAGTYAINRVLSRRNIQGNVYHLSLDVERVAVS